MGAGTEHADKGNRIRGDVKMLLHQGEKAERRSAAAVRRQSLDGGVPAEEVAGPKLEEDQQGARQAAALGIHVDQGGSNEDVHGGDAASPQCAEVGGPAELQRAEMGAGRND